MRRVYPKHENETTYAPFECVVWDMVGPFKYPSLGGCKYSHDGVDRALNLRFVYTVVNASAEVFTAVLDEFIALIGKVPGEFVLI